MNQSGFIVFAIFIFFLFAAFLEERMKRREEKKIRERLIPMPENWEKLIKPNKMEETKKETHELITTVNGLSVFKGTEQECRDEQTKRFIKEQHNHESFQIKTLPISVPDVSIVVEPNLANGEQQSETISTETISTETTSTEKNENEKEEPAQRMILDCQVFKDKIVIFKKVLTGERQTEETIERTHAEMRSQKEFFYFMGF